MSHYKARAAGEVPTGPGACVPYGVITGEAEPATVGLNIRLKDQPEIVVFLLAWDASTVTGQPEDPERFFDRKAPRSAFFGSTQVMPVNRLSPFDSITIDGKKGLGSLARVTRRMIQDQSQAFNNAAEKNEDWGYLAYIPGVAGGKPGESFNVEFKVERFGRFATHPMSEREFRELVTRIAASIKRRPGAWVAP